MQVRGVITLTAAAMLSGLVACEYQPSPTMTDLRAEQQVIETSEEHRAEIQAWQKRRAEGLMREGGWLSLVGLHWIEPGYNSVGSNPRAAVTLPASVPDMVGTIMLNGRQATFQAAADAGVTSGGRPVTSIEMTPDTEGEPTELRVGTTTFHLVERSGRMGVRVKDSESPARRNFHGLTYFPIDGRYRVEATFKPYDPPKQIPIVNVLGMTENMVSPGALVFQIDGQTVSLDPVLETPDADELFLIFGDRTNGRETYGAGRYVYAPLPAAGEQTVTVDFNRAYNPPCVFTDYATCPLPPSQNKLPVRIAAGEKSYK